MIALRSLLASTYNRLRYPRFFRLKRETGGMLPPAVYQRLYEEIVKLPDLDVVEIGGAAGAGSIVISQAMRESGKHSRVIVVERCEGGSRSDYGDREANLARLRRHLGRFGADGNVTLFAEELTLENATEVLALVRTPEIAAFVHDADGRVDRDFQVFWPRLRPGGLIVVDDYLDLPQFRPESERYPDGGTKCLRTFRLLNQLIAWGLFEPFEQVAGTVFGRKPLHADFARFDPVACERILAGIAEERRVWFAAREIAPA